MKHRRICATALALATALCGCYAENTEKVAQTTASGTTQPDTVNDTDRETDTTTSAGNEPIVIDIYSEVSSYSGIQKGWAGEVFLEKFGVKLNIINGSLDDGVYLEKLERGEAGDILLFAIDYPYIEMRDKGLLYDWEKDDLLKDHGSFMSENCSVALEYNRTGNPDGRIYGISDSLGTAGGDYSKFVFSWDLRWDLYEQLGHPEVRNLDDYLNMLIEMKKLCPTDDYGDETYAFTPFADWDDELAYFARTAAAAYYGYEQLGIGLYDPTSGTLYGAADEGSPYIEILRFYNKLYRNGLLDPDAPNLNYDQVAEKVQNGGMLCSFTDFLGASEYSSPEHIRQNRIMASLIPTDAAPLIPGLREVGSIKVLSIAACTKYPELCMDIINYLYTPEGMLTFLYGPKGTYWDRGEDSGLYLTELGMMAQNAYHIRVNKDGTLDDTDYFTMTDEKKAARQTFFDGALQLNFYAWDTDSEVLDSKLEPKERYNYSYWVSRLSEPVTEAAKDWAEYTGCRSSYEYYSKCNITVVPDIDYIASTKSAELEKTFKNVSDCIIDFSWKAIYAESDEEFDALISEMRSAAGDFGYSDCLKWSQDEAAALYAAEQAVTALK